MPLKRKPLDRGPEIPCETDPNPSSTCGGPRPKRASPEGIGATPKLQYIGNRPPAGTLGRGWIHHWRLSDRRGVDRPASGEARLSLSRSCVSGFPRVGAHRFCRRRGRWLSPRPVTLGTMAVNCHARVYGSSGGVEPLPSVHKLDRSTPSLGRSAGLWGPSAHHQAEEVVRRRGLTRAWSGHSRQATRWTLRHDERECHSSANR